MILRLKTKDCGCDRTKIEKELVAHFRKVLNIPREEVSFEVEFVGDIPLDKSGKFRIVVSEIN